MFTPAEVPDADTALATLPNGVRAVAIRLPHVRSASVSVFVRAGSGHESARLNGISHVVEHMAFKGTLARSARQINLDAERLGAEVNAHTDKDHTAFHMHGMARDAKTFVEMLADIVQHPSFPEAELERERQVILQELLEDEDDPVSNAFKLFDAACWGAHALARPVIGNRRNIERLTRADLLEHAQAHYSGANVVVGMAGDIDPAALIAAVQAAFGGLPAGALNGLDAPAYIGGARSRRLAGSNQSHAVFGFPAPSLAEPGHAAVLVAAALFGEGMSSPLLHELRERRALVYHASCSADLTGASGQFVVEASTTPEHLDAFFGEAARLLRAQAERIDPDDLARARNQLMVQRLRTQERPFRRLEEAAQDLFLHGRIRAQGEHEQALMAVSADEVQALFQRMLAGAASAALVGKVGGWSALRLHDWAAPGLGGAVPA